LSWLFLAQRFGNEAVEAETIEALTKIRGGVGGDMRNKVVVLSLVVASCNQPEAEASQVYNPPYTPLLMIDDLKSSDAALGERIDSLAAHHAPATLKLSDGGFAYASTSLGPAPVQWLDASARGSGASLDFKVGNVSTADWNRFSVSIFVRDSDGRLIASTNSQFSKTVPSESWGGFSVQVDDIAPSSISSVDVVGINIENLGLLPDE
jgi:hypothetical protein